MNYLDLYWEVPFSVKTVLVEEKGGNEIAEAAEANDGDLSQAMLWWEKIP